MNSAWSVTRAFAVLVAAIVAAVALIAISNRLPTPLPASAPATQFSAARAMQDIRMIASRPHPTGSIANVAVRAAITARLRAMGLASVEENGVGLSTAHAGATAVAAGSVTNLVATIPGRDRTLPALVLMAHYDSVPNSPGAADDALGCATLLETARLLMAGAQPRRDVVLVFTDGEEPGLLGSSAHFARPANVARTGHVINVEAMGDGGRALMFETGPDAGNLVRLYADVVPLPASDSLSTSLYRLLPNGTDLTHALERGIPGLNLAITGRRDGYHSMRSVPSHLDLGSVQHMGDTVSALARRLADVERLPRGGGERVYFDLGGTWLVHYPAVVGWVLLAVALGLVAIGVRRRRGQGDLTLRATGYGLGWLLAATLGVAVLLWLAGAMMQLSQSGFGDRTGLLSHVGWIEVGVLVIALALLILFAGTSVRRGIIAAIVALAGIVATILGATPIAAIVGLAAAAGLWLCRKRPVAMSAAWLAALLIVTVIATALQIVLPGGAYTVMWPLLAAAAAFAVDVPAGSTRMSRIVAAVLGAVAFAFIALQIHGSFIDFGAPTPQVMAIFVPAVLAAILPWLFVVAAAARSIIVVSAVLIGGVLALAVPAFSEGVRNLEVFRLIDAASGQQYLASATASLDDRARGMIAPGKTTVARRAFGPPYDAPLWVAPVAPVPVSAPTFATTYDAARHRLTITIRPGEPTLALRIALKPSTPLSRVTIGDRPVAFAVKPGAWATVRYAAPPADGLTLTFADVAPGTLELRILQSSENGRLPAFPPNTAPWRSGGMAQLLSRQQTRWGE